MHNENAGLVPGIALKDIPALSNHEDVDVDSAKRRGIDHVTIRARLFLPGTDKAWYISEANGTGTFWGIIDEGSSFTIGYFHEDVLLKLSGPDGAAVTYDSSFSQVRDVPVEWLAKIRKLRAEMSVLLSRVKDVQDEARSMEESVLGAPVYESKYRAIQL